MVPWTPSSHWEVPPIASLQSDTGKGGSPAVLSRYPQSLWAARQRIYHRSMALTPQHIHGLQHPSAYSENDRSTTLYLKTLANDMTSLEAGSLIPCRVSCGLQHLCEKKLVSKIPRSFWSSMTPPLLLLSGMSMLRQWSQDILLEKACPTFPRPKRLGKPWQYSPTPQKHQSTWCMNKCHFLLLIHVKHIINKYCDHIQTVDASLGFWTLD